MGLGDEWVSGVAAGTNDLMISTHPTVGAELEAQRPASSAFNMLKFDNPRDKMNFKMFCSYCHQVGTLVPSRRTVSHSLYGSLSMSSQLHDTS